MKAIADAGIPIMGHIGLTPQTAGNLGGFTVQGKTSDVASDLVTDALALEEAGCFSLVLGMCWVAVCVVFARFSSLAYHTKIVSIQCMRFYASV